jgi:hypothetical protein
MSSMTLIVQAVIGWLQSRRLQQQYTQSLLLLSLVDADLTIQYYYHYHLSRSKILPLSTENLL